MSMYQFSFTNIPNFADHTEEVVIRDSLNNPLDFTNYRNFEMNIGRELADRLGKPGITMTQGDREVLVKGTPTDGRLQFNFKKAKMEKLSGAYVYKANITYTITGVLRVLGFGTISLTSNVGGV